MANAPASVLHERPPGPRGHLLSGNLPEFRAGRLEFLTDCQRRYGDYVALRFGPKRILLVSDPAAIEYVLTTGSRNFIKHFALRLNPLVFGNGLLTSEGEFWRRQRRLIQPAFARERIAAYSQVVVDHTERMLQNWAAGKDYDILDELMQLTLGIAAKTLFDADAASDAEEVSAAMAVAQECFLARFSSGLIIPASIPTPVNLRLRRAVRRLDRVLYRFIDERRRSGQEKDDLLSILLRARDEDDGRRMTDQQLRDEAMTLFLAGHETTALALTWTWYLLARNPACQERLVAEIDRVLGQRPPTYADLERLPFTEAVVQESMRLYPPAFILGREVVTPCPVGPYRVARGVTVLMSQWVVQRDPRFFAEPEAFDPERWLDGRAKALPRYAYFPFGGGPRRCIGESFAMMEAMLALALITRRFRFTLRGDHPVVPAPHFTLRPQFGVRAVLEKR